MVLDLSNHEWSYCLARASTQCSATAKVQAAALQVQQASHGRDTGVA